MSKKWSNADFTRHYQSEITRHFPRYIYIFAFVGETLKKRAVFIGGPRQVGTTTFALELLSPGSTPQHPAYLDWDYVPSADKIKKTMLPLDGPTLVFNEVHKFRKWKSWIKGIIDTEKGRRRTIVTGSARLDLYQHGCFTTTQVLSLDRELRR